MRPPRTIPKKFLWLAAGLSLLTGILLVEGTLRWLGIGYGNAPFDPDPVLHHVNPRNYSYQSYSPTGEYGGFETSFDAEGWRVLPRSTSPSPTYRFALMGDSFAAALEVPAEESLAGRLAQSGNHATEVRNFAVTSYSPVLYNLQWDRDVSVWRPTHVLVLLYANDPADDESYASEARRDASGRIVAVPHGESPWLRQLSRQSYLFRLIRKRWAEWSRRSERGVAIGGFTEPDAQLGEITQTSLTELRAKVENSGARFFLSVVPSKAVLFGKLPADTPTFSDRVRGWAGENRVDFIDLSPAFREASRGRVLYFPRDIHWNAEGNRIAAETVARKLPKLFTLP